MLVPKEEGVAPIELPPGRTVIGRQHLRGFGRDDALLGCVHQEHAEILCNEDCMTVTCLNVNPLGVMSEGDRKWLRKGERQAVTQWAGVVAILVAAAGTWVALVLVLTGVIT